MTIGEIHGIRKLVEQRFNIADIHSFKEKKLNDTYSYFLETKPEMTRSSDDIIFSKDFKFTGPIPKSFENYIKSKVSEDPARFQNLNESLKTSDVCLAAILADKKSTKYRFYKSKHIKEVTKDVHKKQVADSQSKTTISAQAGIQPSVKRKKHNHKKL